MVAGTTYPFPLLAQQTDTVPALRIPDSLAGINPEFIKFELLKAEVERLRKLEARKASFKFTPREPVDTICHFSPTSPTIPLESSAYSNLFNSSYERVGPLFGLKEFEESYRKPAPVFVETRASQALSANYPTVKLLNNSDLLPSLFIIPSLLLLLLFIVVRKNFGHYLVGLSQSALQLFHSEKVYNEKTALGPTANFVLDLLYFISLPFILLFGAYLWLPSLVEHTGSLQFLAYALGAMMALRTFRFVTIKTMSFVSDRRNELGFVYFNQLTYSRIVGIVMAPLVFLLSYSEGLFHNILAIGAGAFIAIILVFNLIRTIHLFIRKGFSLFYLLLYLCALEIIPLFIVYKELTRVE